MFDEAQATVLQELHGDVDEVPRGRDTPRAVFPEQRDLRLVRRPDGAVRPSQAADRVEFLSEHRARGIVEVGRAKLRAAGHRPGRDVAVSWIQATIERSECRTRPGAVERAGRTPP